MSGGWYGWLETIHERNDPTMRGDDIEAMVCPNDGEPLQQGPNGQLHCPFDGYVADGLPR